MTGVKAASVRDLYVGLLLKSVANLIYGPPPADPWNDVLFKRGSNPQEQIKTPAHTMVGVLRLENLRQLTQRVIDEGVPGDFIETGVWRGGCCILMRGILAANGIHDRKVYVADSFQGVPAPKPESYPQDAGMVLHTFPALSVPADVVRANFALYGLLDENVVFVEGFFSETLPAFQGGPFSLIRLDGDLYESTYVALEYLYPKLSTGGFAVIDDYGAIPACRQAVTDYRAKHGIDEPMEQVDWTGAWWRKTG